MDANDNPPKETGHVLVLVNDIVNQWQEVLNCYICPEYGNIFWEFISGEDYPCIVTDWMPLPKPPEPPKPPEDK